MVINRKLIKIGDQVLSKKNPWPKVISGLLVTTLALLLVWFSQPNFTGAEGFFSNLINFFSFEDIFIGIRSITILDTFLRTLNLLWLTFLYSIFGTFVGVMLSIPLAVLSSKNVVKKWYIYLPFRVVMSIIRSIPPILIAFFFSYALAGTLAGAIAISVFVTSIMTKWLFEDLDSLDLSSFEALQAIGISKTSAIIKAVFPALMKKVVSFGLYAFEIVIRFAAILGVVGISTIGILLKDDYSTPDKWGHMTIVLAVLIVFILLVEVFSIIFKKYVIERTNPQLNLPKGPTTKQIHFAKQSAPKVWIVKSSSLILLVALVIFALAQIEWRVASSSEMEVFIAGLAKFFNPDWSVITDFGDPNNGVILALEAIAVAGAAVVIGLFFSFIFGILAARNITGNYLSWFFKFLIMVIRSVPAFVYAILFILLSPEFKFIFAGTLALGIHSIGMLGKLTYEKIETIDPGGQIALDVVGGTKVHKLRWAIISESLPSILSNALYRWEINFKSTVEIGAVGASAFGFAMIGSSIGPSTFDKLSPLILITIVVVLLLEQISNFGRRYLMTGHFVNKNNFISRFFRHKRKFKSYLYAESFKVPFRTSAVGIKYNILYGQTILKGSQVKRVQLGKTQAVIEARLAKLRLEAKEHFKEDLAKRELVVKREIAELNKELATMKGRSEGRILHKQIRGLQKGLRKLNKSETDFVRKSVYKTLYA